MTPDDLVLIPGGEFLMGQDDGRDEERPVHRVTVAPFRLCRYQVTNADFAAFRKFSFECATLPVTSVNWFDAMDYCRWLSAQWRMEIRLPTEAEWEFAARGSDGRIYPWGEDFRPAQVNSAESRLAHVLPVDAHPQNVSPFRVREMSGNVWEWCRDDFALYRGSAAQIAIPPGAKAIRGGSYESDRRHVTTAARNLERPATQSPTIGFRCAQ